MEKPILFNTEMVQAILEGRKTSTRRVIKLPECMTGKPVGEAGNSDNPLGFMYPCGIKRPPYQPGDILYVRETWSFQSCDICGGKCDTQPPDCFKGEPGCYVYRTNYGTTEDDTFPPSMFIWHPSIHMPRAAARIFLKVTDVRVEKIQSIDYEGVVKEGIKEGYDSWVKAFKDLWNSTIKKQDIDRYGWTANPWVWVIEFERVEG